MLPFIFYLASWFLFHFPCSLSDQLLLNIPSYSFFGFLANPLLFLKYLGITICILIMCVCVLVALLCLTPCNLINCGLPGSSLYGISQARILEWVAISFSRGSSWHRDQTQVFCITGRFFTIWAIGKSTLHSYSNQNSAVQPIYGSNLWVHQ